MLLHRPLPRFDAACGCVYRGTVSIRHACAKARSKEFLSASKPPRPRGPARLPLSPAVPRAGNQRRRRADLHPDPRARPRVRHRPLHPCGPQRADHRALARAHGPHRRPALLVQPALLPEDRRRDAHARQDRREGRRQAEASRRALRVPPRARAAPARDDARVGAARAPAHAVRVRAARARGGPRDQEQRAPARDRHASHRAEPWFRGARAAQQAEGRVPRSSAGEAARTPLARRGDHAPARHPPRRLHGRHGAGRVPGARRVRGGEDRHQRVHLLRARARRPRADRHASPHRRHHPHASRVEGGGDRARACIATHHHPLRA